MTASKSLSMLELTPLDYIINQSSIISCL